MNVETLPFDELPPEADRPPTIQEDFERFHAAHPNVYDGLVRLTRSGVAAGATRLGMKQLFEVLRWERTLAGLPAEDEAFKLNNNYTSRYARLVMEREPDLDGIFATREITS